MRINRYLLLLGIPLVVAGCGPDDGSATASPSPEASPMAMESPSGDVVVIAEVVAVDVPGRTVTLKDRAAAGASPMAGGTSRTIMVDPAALAALDALRPGDPVDVTCRTEVMPMTSPGMAGASPGMGSPGMASPGMGMETTGMGMGTTGMATITTCSSVIAIAKTAGGMSPQP
ncbi:MAG TPA: hypothetical protein VMR21_09345 [Vicinamibacteria bacterium]|nr:hypothetical protein [Vicinamibacteria bacterium]